VIHESSGEGYSPRHLVGRGVTAATGVFPRLEGASQTLALLPGISGAFLRRAFLSVVLAQCDRGSEISFGVLFSQAGAKIEENVYIGPRCHIGLAHIQKNTLIAAGVHIPSGGQTHAFDDPNIPIKEQGGERKLVTIGEGAWIGSCAVVMADVGKGSIIAAGAVVTKPIPDNVIAGGVPAKVIRGRFDQPKTSP
jgi:virginiamycin A acetyltransferase